MEYPKSMYKGEKSIAAEHFIANSAEEEELAKEDGYVPGHEFWASEEAE